MNYHNFNFIDFVDILDNNYGLIIKELLKIDFHQKSLPDKELERFLNHLFIKILFNDILDKKSIKTCVYINTQKIPQLSQQYDMPCFLNFYVEFIKDLKNKLNVRTVAYSLDMRDFINQINTTPEVYDIFTKAIKKPAISSYSIFSFLKSKGLTYISNWYNTDPNLKLILST